MQNGSVSSYSADLGGYEEQKELWSCERLQGAFFFFLTFILHAEEVLRRSACKPCVLSPIVLGSLCKIKKVCIQNGAENVLILFV